MKFKILLLILLLGRMTLAAQNPTIEGRVTDSDSRAVCAASVILRSLPDSTYVAGMASDEEGRFRFAADGGGEYLLTVNYLGFKTFDRECRAGDVVEVALQPDTQVLQSVVVRGERPLVKAEGGKLIYDTHTLSQLNIVENAWDVLTKLPGVEASEGNVSLIGSRSVTVLLDGRPSTLSAAQLYSLLKSIPADQVSRSEVMTSAPARYHTNGAVINLVTERKHEKQVTGQLSGHYTDAFYGTGGVAGNLSLVSPRVKWDLLYSSSWGKRITPTELYSRHRLGKEIHEIRIDNRSVNDLENYEVRTGLDFALSEKSSLNLTYTGNFSPTNEGRSHSDGNFQRSENFHGVDTRLHNLSVSYSAPFGLSLGVDYTSYDMSQRQDLEVFYHADNRYERLRTIEGQAVDNVLAYADQSHTLGQWNLGYGVLYAHSSNLNEQFFGECETDRETRDLRTRFVEDKVNFYLSGAGRFGKAFSVDASLKGEYYRIGDYEKWSVYPRFSLMYAPGKRHIFNLSLTSDRTYPAYWAMQSSVNYIDGYTEIQGSPDLRPSTEYGLTLAYILNQRYIFSLFYEYSGDESKQTPYQTPDRLALIYKSVNWDYEQKLGVNLSLPFSCGKWLSSRLTLTGLGIFDRCDDFFDMGFNRRKFVAVCSLKNTFRLHKNLMVELSGRVQSPAIQGTFDIGYMFTMSAALKWTFLHERMSLGVDCNDLFDTGYHDLRLRYKGQMADICNNSRYNRTTTLRLTYRFGDYKERRMKQVDTSRFGH